MALIKCEDCGNDVSMKATACPSCGCPLQTDEKWKDIDNFYLVDDLITGRIKKVSQDCAYIGLDLNIYGLVDISKLNEALPKEGDEICARVIDVDKSKKKIRLEYVKAINEEDKKAQQVHSKTNNSHSKKYFDYDIIPKILYGCFLVFLLFGVFWLFSNMNFSNSSSGTCSVCGSDRGFAKIRSGFPVSVRWECKDCRAIR